MIKIFMASLGCSKNLVDAEIMLGETLDAEFGLELAPESADVIIVNTCGFIEEAREEARAVIREFLEVKEQAGHPVKVVATGCWAERWPDELLAEFPGLDGVWGLSTPSSMREAIRALAGGRTASGLGQRPTPRDGARLLTTLPSYAYLRISDGCDNRCHYCAIPLIRGGLRSRLPQAILDEAMSLEDQGARELIVISQDTTAYAHDLKTEGVDLAALLHSLLSAVETPRIRLLYAHPAHLSDEVCSLLLSEPRLCRYLDLPVQHVSDRILERMGRGYGQERIRQIVERFAGHDFTLRTTMLMGFPGETEADFEEVLAFVKEGHFQQLGAFAYSPERDTPALQLDGQVPPEEAARRRDAVLEAQRDIAFAWLDARVGGKEKVLVDAPAGSGWVQGRTIHEAPDADGAVFLPEEGCRPGDIIEACIKMREGYDLIAEKKTAKHRRHRGRR